MQRSPKVPTFFDEAGHRVATQYLFAVLHGQMAVDRCVGDAVIFGAFVFVKEW